MTPDRLSLQDRIDPFALDAGLIRKAKGYAGRSGDVLFEVFFDPEPRIANVETVTTLCSLAEPRSLPAHEFYSFDQIHAATRDWRASYQKVPRADRELAIVRDFEQFTAPFIRKATSLAQVAEMLKQGEIPPSNRQPAPRGSIQQLFVMGRDFGSPEVAQAALVMAREVALDSFDHDLLTRWFVEIGVDVALRPPAGPKLRRGLSLRWRPRSSWSHPGR